MCSFPIYSAAVNIYIYLHYIKQLLLLQNAYEIVLYLIKLSKSCCFADQRADMCFVCITIKVYFRDRRSVHRCTVCFEQFALLRELCRELLPSYICDADHVYFIRSYVVFN